MSLYLVQHGKSLPEEIDPDRPLSDEGRAAVYRIARKAAKYNVPVSQIIHSGKTRTQQTAEIFSAHVKPESGMRKASGLNPNDDVTSIISGQRL